MARYIFFSDILLGLLLICLSLQCVHSDIEPNIESSVPIGDVEALQATLEAKGLADDLGNLPQDANQENDQEELSNEELFSEIDGETLDEEVDGENLINGQPVDIVHKFNINSFNEDGSNLTDFNGNSTLASNLTSLNDTFGSNITKSNSSKPSIRWPCKPYTMPPSNETSSPSVAIINNETTLGNVISSMNGTKECGVMLFYSPYCEFCTNVAPLYNAVGRSYSNLIVIASDAQKVMGMSARYGIVGIPTILLFYSGKAVAKYNRTRTVEDFEQFVKELTGLKPTIALNISREDELGPISSTPKDSRDYYLIFSLSFVVLFVISKLLGSILLNLLIRIFNRIKNLFKREKID